MIDFSFAVLPRIYVLENFCFEWVNIIFFFRRDYFGDKKCAYKDENWDSFCVFSIGRKATKKVWMLLRLGTNCREKKSAQLLEKE